MAETLVKVAAGNGQSSEYCLLDLRGLVGMEWVGLVRLVVARSILLGPEAINTCRPPVSGGWCVGLFWLICIWS